MKDKFFFFQAEDGIRDLTVTGVQTCALPISGLLLFASDETWTFTSSLLAPDVPGIFFGTFTFGHAVKSSTIATTPAERRSDRLNECSFCMLVRHLTYTRRLETGYGS